MRFRLVLVAVLAGGIFASCKPKPESKEPQAPAQAQPAQKPAPDKPVRLQAKDLAGAWKTVKGGVGDEISFEIANGEGVYRSFLNSSPMEVGAWTLAGDTLSIAIECRSCGTTYYKVSLVNNLLAMQPQGGEVEQYQRIIESSRGPAGCAEVLRLVRDNKQFGLAFSEPVPAPFPMNPDPEKPGAEKGLKTQAEVKGGKDFEELNQKAGQVGQYLVTIGFAVDPKYTTEIINGYTKNNLAVIVALQGSSENAEETHQIVVSCK